VVVQGRASNWAGGESGATADKTPWGDGGISGIGDSITGAPPKPSLCGAAPGSGPVFGWVEGGAGGSISSALEPLTPDGETAWRGSSHEAAPASAELVGEVRPPGAGGSERARQRWSIAV